MAGPYTPLMIDDQSVVAAKQMEAIRESVEDYEYFVLLRQALERAKAAGRSDTAVAKAQALLAEGAPRVLAAPGAEKLFWRDKKDRTLADAVRVEILETLSALKAEHTPATDDTMLQARSLVSAGEPARLQRVMARAREGGPVTVAVIGGSITAGAAATRPETQYGALVAEWWRLKFPRAKIKFVNAGIGATGSNFGALRARRDLLSQQPDFVVVEYGVNDRNTQAAAETLEGLIRQILKQPNQPAVMMLFTVLRNGDNAQEWQSKIGLHYGLPMVSFRDALWPEIQSGRRKWEDVEADQVHPNDRGHAYCATFITAVLDRVLRDLPPKDMLSSVKPLPQPLLGDLFEHVGSFLLPRRRRGPRRLESL